MLLQRSKTALIITLSLWAATIVFYVAFGTAGGKLLPTPFNTIIHLLLAAAACMSGNGVLVGLLMREHARQLGALEERLRAYVGNRIADHEADVDVRYGSLYALMGRFADRACAMDAPTQPIPRQRLVVAGRAAVPPPPEPIAPEVVDLTQRIHRNLVHGGDGA